MIRKNQIWESIKKAKLFQISLSGNAFIYFLSILIGGIFEVLDTIPLSAKGTLGNIHIYPLAPSAVAYELAEMMKKTVERPINLIHGRKEKPRNGR